MAITDAKKVDYLWKKLGYGKSKTETNVVRKAPEEAVASPLLLRGDKIWTQAHSIPITLPDDSTVGVVEVYHTGGVKECTELAGTNPSRTWQTGLVDWIPPEFGSTYQVKVYIHTSSNSGSAGNVAYEVAATGSGNNDEWFFDYQSGVLHFIGTNLPTGVNFSGKSVYVSGGRYIGQQGVQQFPDNFTFTGSTINQDVTNANFTFDTAGSGKFIFNTTTAPFHIIAYTLTFPLSIFLMQYNHQLLWCKNTLRLKPDYYLHLYCPIEFLDILPALHHGLDQ